MAAPSAPHIYAASDGTNILVRWQPVPDATDYNVYVAEQGGDFGIEEQVAEADIEADDWFRVYLTGLVGPADVKVTALNGDEEESGFSNRKQFGLSGQADNEPTPALHHVRKC